MRDRIRLVEGDITRLDVEAVVTAANRALRSGSGVDGAVHAAAGPELVRASMALAPCPAGEARVTGAFNMPLKGVIHAVGPIYASLEEDGPLLRAAYRSSLQLASQEEFKSLAFPCISTGIYGFPKGPARDIAIDTVCSWLEVNALPETVTFCCFGQADFDLYATKLTQLGLISS